MEIQELAMTALRALGVYAFMLAVIRLMGKRTVGMFTAFDLLVALMLGEVVDEIIYGDVTSSQGAVAIAVIALAKYSTAWLSYFDHGLNKLLEGTPTVIIREGKLVRTGMRQVKMNDHDVMSELRLASIDDLEEVKLASIETDGEMSVILQEWAEPLQKADLTGQAKKEKERGKSSGPNPVRDLANQEA
jgi:uncharacterized membrane protein YcaP (DUF421 family)